MVDQKDLLGSEVDKIIPALEFDELLSGEDASNIKIGESVFRVLSNIVKIGSKSDERYIMMLYWIDQTNYFMLGDKYRDENLLWP